MESSGYHNRHLLLHLFAVSLMVHYGFTNSVHLWQFVSASFASLWLLLYPRSIYFTIVAVVMTLADYLFTYPKLSNHAVIQLFICLAIIFLLIREGLFRKKIYFNEQEKTALYRVLVFLIYFFSGFHKLNWGFIDSDQSCVLSLNYKVTHFLGMNVSSTPLLVTRFLQIATFILELIVPFGLLFQRTCKLSVFLLFGFHAYLFTAGFAHFASVSIFMLAGCLLSFSDSSIANLLQPKLKLYTIIAFIAASVSFIFCNILDDNKNESGHLNRTFYIACGIYLIAFIYCTWLFVRVSNPPDLRLKTVVSHKILLPALFIILWGMEPYYGLSNRANMSMYSNMITMAGRDNHLLISTKYTKIIPFEEDYLQILEVSPNLKKFIGGSYKYYYYPIITFRYNASKWIINVQGPVHVRILYKGREIDIPDLSKSEFSKSFWYDRYFYYRPTPMRGYGVCVW